MLREWKVFGDELRKKWNMCSVGALLVCWADLTGHVGRHVNRVNVVLWEFGVGKRNFKEIIKFLCLVWVGFGVGWAWCGRGLV